MEIDPDLYGSSPQPTSHPLFAHRESPASLSSTRSFSYTAPGLRPFHTLQPCVKVPNLLRSGPMGRNSAMLKAESIGDVIIAKLRRRLTSIAVRRTTIEPIFICKPHHII